MFNRQVLIPLGVYWLVAFVLSGVFKTAHGVTGVIGAIGWFSFVLLTLAFIVVAVVTIIRNRRVQA